MTPKYRIILAAAAIALTTLTLKAKWVSTWAEEAAGKKAHDPESYRAVVPSGEIRSMTCSADGKTLYVACVDVWVKGPTSRGIGDKFNSALFKSTDGGETWTVLKGD